MTAVLPKVSRLSSRVIRVLGCNPGPMTLQGTNTYLIGTGRKRVLLDTGDNGKEEYISLLQNVLKEQNCVLQQIIISHWHHDHIGGVSDILREIDSSCQISKLPRALSTLVNEDQEKHCSYLKDGDVINIEGATLQVIATPGHSDDHIIVLLEEEKSVFSGDCILGEGTAVFEDLYTYMNSLHKLLELKPSVIYPGHGPVVEEPVKKINNYIQHRLQRETQILMELEKVKPIGLSVEELVSKIYTQTPKHLYAAAGVNVSHHLSKLLQENKIYESKNEAGSVYALK